MSFLDTVKKVWWNLANLDQMLADSPQRERMEQGALRRDYYSGQQRRQLKIRSGQADDNLTVNFTGLIVKRAVSMLLGDGVEFDLPGEQTEDADGNMVDPPNQQYVDMVWQANKKDILMHKLAQFGAINGTCYVKIIPEGTEARDQEGVYVPRLVALDPIFMEIVTHPEDIDMVLEYINKYVIMWNGKETARKEVVRREFEEITGPDGAIISLGETRRWVIEQWYANNDTQGKWAKFEEDVVWEYEFPPIIHWQNQPLAGSVYGEPDITDDVIEIQDRLNFIASNISKIIRYHSHPKTWGRMAGNASKQSWGADEMVVYNSPDAMLQNLEMQSDLTASQNYLGFLKTSIFEIARTTDLSTFKDRVGQLTNFGLRVLFLDSQAKLGSKQEIYGEALTEINHRLLVLNGDADTDGGVVIWPEVLPTNEMEQIQGLTFDLDRKLLSRKSAANIRGYDYEEEQTRIEEDQASETNVGELLLRSFNRGEGV